ncbi:hypothetical protein BBJ28_00021625 [Nothophytophthora sp. Chile5]|nr:hypothetical protein BBJ28_00021625 [Nothophytophthora sp. Chile5]
MPPPPRRPRAGSAAADDASPSSSSKPRASKLRASRERRQRDRERSLDGDELEQRFGRVSLALAVDAPVFVPAAQRLDGGGGGSALPKRSLAFVTDRNEAKRGVAPPPRRPRRPAAAKSHAPPVTRSSDGRLGAAPARKSAVPGPETRPRRARIGAKGFAKSAAAAGPKADAPSLQRHRRQTRKLSMTAAELEDEGKARDAADDAAGSDSDSSDDETYPETASSAFPQQLTLFSQQKRIPKRAARRDEVIDTIFTALFAGSGRRARDRAPRAVSAFGDDTGTDTDEPNEEFVKRGLAAALFKDQLSVQPEATTALAAAASPAAAADRLISPAFVHALVNALRFEDFRTPSARLDILRAVHKSCPSKRLHLARALADATTLRVAYVAAVAGRAQALGVERSSPRVIADHAHDHGHGFTELLRYVVEHVDEGAQDAEQQTELLRNCLASLVALWRAHWVDPAGSDDEELLSCAGQLVAYLPTATGPLLRRLLSAWPTRFPRQEVGAVRMLARVVMSGPPLPQVDPSRRLQRRVFARLARAVRSPQAEVAKEALAFTGCQFALVHFLGRDAVVFQAVTQALHANAEGHWHEGVRGLSEEAFDRALDFAP